jgi:hypothetical protein
VEATHKIFVGINTLTGRFLCTHEILEPMDSVGEMVNILLHPKSKVPEKQRYECFKNLLKVSEDTPDALYPYWDDFMTELEDTNSDHKYEAVLILANLAGVDSQGKAVNMIDRYIELLADSSFVVALNTANNVGKFAKAKKELQDKITRALLNLTKSKHKHKDLLMSGAILSFNEFFEDSQKKDQIIAFVKKLETGSSPKARKLAKAFIRNHEI